MKVTLFLCATVSCLVTSDPMCNEYYRRSNITLDDILKTTVITMHAGHSFKKKKKKLFGLAVFYPSEC